MSERRKSLPVKVAVLSIDEYSQLYKSGRVKLLKGRSKPKAQWKKDPKQIFEKLLSKAPDIGLKSDNYVFIEYQGQDKEGFIDIRKVKDKRALNRYAAEIFETLQALEQGDELWENYVQKKNQNKRHFNGLFLQDILQIKGCIDESQLKNLSIESNLNPEDNVELQGLNESESQKINKYSMTYAFGWKAALTVLSRKLKELHQNDWKEYWPAPNVKDDLETIRKQISNGSILCHEVYKKLKNFDKALENIEQFPNTPLAYLVVVFHYCSFAINNRDFKLKDFQDDLTQLENEHGIQFASAAAYLVGQCLHDDQLMNIYHSLNQSTQEKKNPIQIPFSHKGDTLSGTISARRTRQETAARWRDGSGSRCSSGQGIGNAQ